MSVAKNISDHKYEVTDLDLHEIGSGREWRDREAQLVRQFWLDVALEFHAENFPRRQWERMTELAWEQGHSGGLHQVLNELIELIELIQLGWQD